MDGKLQASHLMRFAYLQIALIVASGAILPTQVLPFKPTFLCLRVRGQHILKVWVQRYFAAVSLRVMAILVRNSTSNKQLQAQFRAMVMLRL